MDNNTFKNRRWILMVGLLAALNGTVCFFPLNIEHRYSCLYHRLFDHSEPVDQHNHLSGIGEFREPDKGMVSKLGIDEDPGSRKSMTIGRSDLLNTYLKYYALTWWISVALFVYCIYTWMRMSQRNLNEENH